MTRSRGRYDIFIFNLPERDVRHSTLKTVVLLQLKQITVIFFFYNLILKTDMSFSGRISYVLEFTSEAVPRTGVTRQKKNNQKELNFYEYPVPLQNIV